MEMKPYLQRRVAWEWWQEELDHRVAVRAAQALLVKDDLNRDQKAELAQVLPAFYLDTETRLDLDDETIPTAQRVASDHIV
jgi:hypothetical protein